MSINSIMYNNTRYIIQRIRLSIIYPYINNEGKIEEGKI